MSIWPRFSLSTPAARQTEKSLLAGGLIAFCLITLWAVYFLPMNMDESLVYHLLACETHPFSYLHTFRESCTNHNQLTLPFGLQIERPYPYIGPLQGLLYAPIYALFHNAEAQYWFGVGTFLLLITLLSRRTEKPIISFGLMLACLPLLVQLIHDDGVLKIQMLTYPLGAMTMQRLLKGKGLLQFFYGVIFALLIFNAMVDKIFFFYLLPGFVCFCVALAEIPDWASLRQHIFTARNILMFSATLTLLLIMSLFFATTIDGEFYLFWLRDFSEGQRSLGAMFQSFLAFLFYWPGYTHHILVINSSLGNLLPLGFLTFAWLGGCVFGAIRAPKFNWQFITPRTTLLLLSLVVTSIVFLIFHNVWSGHHFIFLWLPLLVLLCDLVGRLSPKWQVGLGTCYIALNLISLLLLLPKPAMIQTAREKEAIFSYLQSEVPASTALVNFSSWGGYFIHALYAPTNQLVTYIEPLTTEEASKLYDLAQKTHRTIYNVCFDASCNSETLGLLFSRKLHFRELIPSLPHWHLFVGEQPIKN